MFDPTSWSTGLPSYMGALLLGYLCGSIPFGLLLTRFAGAGDLRAIGSGNIGATNVLRTGRKGLAVLTFLCDALKGTVAVLLADHFGGQDLAVVAGFGAFLGHLFPVWLKFKGGKGVSTYIGVLLGLVWPAAVAFCLVWLLVAFVSRYSSLSALVASVATPLLLWWDGYGQELQLFLLLTVLLWYTHRGNIARLMGGTETKIGHKAG
ncbi:glycerol-3-phosphate 1-O-acyltransferase PlsY [Xanthobacteraceae bacterium Astr-EGSB]|uniref:glycerol-3-phosphate 1-O-acyltransferase PlsY n=1 Tax=Astrobacterium formosum TaxID=3069710 RepID=UPI0027B579A0|nr:glycerol-3-phosphate 1-O-acyltransferase PlsY [Xanthobacteraceae bacterium Astr-EGSB]